MSDDEWTPIDRERLDAIRGFAGKAIDGLTKIAPHPIRYDLESVTFADGYIRRCRAAGLFQDPGNQEGFVTVFGAYLGESFVHECEGEWVEANGVVGIRLGPRFVVYPFIKVQKFLSDDADSIASFFEMAPALRDARANPEAHGVRVMHLSDLKKDGD